MGEIGLALGVPVHRAVETEPEQIVGESLVHDGLANEPRDLRRRETKIDDGVRHALGANHDADITPGGQEPSKDLEDRFTLCGPVDQRSIEHRELVTVSVQGQLGVVHRDAPLRRTLVAVRVEDLRAPLASQPDL